MATLFLSTAAMSRALQSTAASRVARMRFYLLTSLGFLGYLHGACAIFVVILSLVSFAVAQLAAGCKHGAASIWACNLGLLLAARLGNGFRFARVAGVLAPLDAHRGVVRWEICFNLSVLRMLSYSLDLHWRRLHLASGVHCRQVGQSPSAPRAGVARWRQQAALPGDADYGLLPCLAYVLYVPLYLAGPIITFQDFAWQLRRGVPASVRAIVRYAARFAADWACLELLTHCLYFNSIAKHQIGMRFRSFGLRYGALEMAMSAFWVLCFMWLKFAVIWRFFRLAALLDGVDPPENMRRCFANNYDLEGFWRGWHSSYNQWLVRYMYVPLGGSTRRVWIIWPIFFFVALWHDLEWRLMSWAWLVCLAFLPEMAAKQWARSQRFDAWRHTMAFRHACAAAAAVNIAALMAANLAGYVIGLDGLKELLVGMLVNSRFVVATLATFWSAANLMLLLREREARQTHAE
ncbi:membrane-bound O-acyltransferase isoform X1 [Micractinium conductrix]|uniref:Membrane-bound O-acyltransferase isoform X1 n=1 Tax=Micractinium conductrix TaxID=554055 RepID=A0A2P6VKN4_9CHLO|nr:membrane-bound O-acyltransferase isoform X1 [Micractinium conductrix]|eukprot:PSC74649.1 membrane-bound O-acyltransferase isoform X1 [Micractinium conductrix]